MMRSLLIGLVLLLANAEDASSQVGKLYPVDEAHEDSTLVAFRLHLMEAVGTHDTAFVYAHLAPDIVNSFGGDGGIAEFKEHWEPSSPNTDLWRVLGRVVGGGGTYSDSTFRAPYYYAAFPARTYDAFQYGVVVGERVNVRAQPTTNSPVVTQLSYDIVRVLDFFPHTRQAEDPLADWVQVRLNDGREGYIARQYMGSAVGYRAIFKRRAGRWLLTALVAGD